MLIGETVNNFSQSTAYIGVGNGSTAFSAGHTTLQGTGGSILLKNVNITPVRSGQTLTFATTFTTGEANWTWYEWGIFNAPSSGDMLNRVLAINAAKNSAESWNLSVNITINAV